jgi:hypothetical protein
MPILWATGHGSDVMQPMAISVGGMVVSLLATIFIAPCLFCAVDEWQWERRAEQRSSLLLHHETSTPILESLPHRPHWWTRRRQNDSSGFVSS